MLFYPSFSTSPPKDAPSDYDIKAMPTFMAFKNGEMVDSVVGPHIEQVKQMVARLK